MTFDAEAVGQRAVVLIAIFVIAWIAANFGRPLLFYGAIILFLLGHWGWALIALFAWNAFEDAHRRMMAEERAAGLYNGPWID